MPEEIPPAGGPSATGAPLAPPPLRASHADRDRVVDVLTVAAGDGLLSADELDERLEAALSARTLDELAPLTADLPAAAGAPGVAVGDVKDLVRVDHRGARSAASTGGSCRGAWRSSRSGARCCSTSPAP